MVAGECAFHATPSLSSKVTLYYDTKAQLFEEKQITFVVREVGCRYSFL